MYVVIGPEYILFAGASVHLSAGKYTGWSSEVVKIRKNKGKKKKKMTASVLNLTKGSKSR